MWEGEIWSCFLYFATVLRAILKFSFANISSISISLRGFLLSSCSTNFYLLFNSQGRDLLTEISRERFMEKILERENSS